MPTVYLNVIDLQRDSKYQSYGLNLIFKQLKKKVMKHGVKHSNLCRWKKEENTPQLCFVLM